MADNRGSKPTVERDAVAAYLASRLEELTQLAQRNGLSVVAYLLDMALMETKTVAGQAAKPLDRSR